MKFVAFALALIMTIGCFTAVAEDSVWQVKSYVDDFGDETGEKYVVAGPFLGTFSNSATTNSELTSYVFCDGTDLWIRLFEYGDYQVNNIFSDTVIYHVSVKATLNCGTTKVFNFKGGIAPGGSDIYVFDQMYFDNYTGELAASEINGVRYETLIDILKNCTVIKFAIRIDDNSMDKYNFTIENASGLSEALDSTNEFGVTIGTKVSHADWGEGEIISLFYDDGKMFAGIYFESRNGAPTNIQIPWAFDTGLLSIIE